MTVPAFHVEAKLHAFRKTQEGVVVSFVVSPVDMPPQLALDPLGTRYMLALAAIGDDERPIEVAASSKSLREKFEEAVRQPVPYEGLDKPSLPPAERPGVEPSSPTARARASERYAGLPPMEQAREDAGMMAKDERFRAWACEQKYGIAQKGLVTLGEDMAAQFIRDHCCGGNTRKLIATDPEAYRKFLALKRLFHEAIGVIPEMRS